MPHPTPTLFVSSAFAAARNSDSLRRPRWRKTSVQNSVSMETKSAPTSESTCSSSSTPSISTIANAATTINSSSSCSRIKEKINNTTNHCNTSNHISNPIHFDRRMQSHRRNSVSHLNNIEPEQISFTAMFATLAAAAAVFAVAHLTSAAPSVISGVTRVIDGDTLVVDGVRIRLRAVDAPELAQTCITHSSHRHVACGDSAKSAVKDLIESARQHVSCVPHGRPDRYGRVVATCTTPDGTDVAAALVSRGLAVAYRQYGTDYVELEEQARAAHRGVWATDFDMPWEWRKMHRH